MRTRSPFRQCLSVIICVPVPNHLQALAEGVAPGPQIHTQFQNAGERADVGPQRLLRDQDGLAWRLLLSTFCTVFFSQPLVPVEKSTNQHFYTFYSRNSYTHPTQIEILHFHTTLDHTVWSKVVWKWSISICSGPRSYLPFTSFHTFFFLQMTRSVERRRCGRTSRDSSFYRSPRVRSYSLRTRDAHSDCCSLGVFLF